MSIHAAIDLVRDDAATYINHYFAKSGVTFTGAQFETYGTQGSDPDLMSLEDIFSTSLLAVPMPGSAALSILNEDRENIRKLLSQIPQDLNIENVPDKDYEKYLGKTSEANELWKLLSEYNGVGPTRVSKLLARKRPNLIPIRDSIISNVIGRGKKNDWELWWEALQDKSLVEFADQLRQTTNQHHLSTLRVFDVVLWYPGKFGKHKN